MTSLRLREVAVARVNATFTALVIIVAPARRRADGSCIDPAIATPPTIATMARTTRISISVRPRRFARRAITRRAESPPPNAALPTKRGSLALGVGLRKTNVVVGPFFAVRSRARACDLVRIARELVWAAPRVFHVVSRIEVLLGLELIDAGAVLARVDGLPLHGRLAGGAAGRLGRRHVGPLLRSDNADRNGGRQHPDDGDDDDQLDQRQTSRGSPPQGGSNLLGLHLLLL